MTLEDYFADNNPFNSSAPNKTTPRKAQATCLIFGKGSQRLRLLSTTSPSKLGVIAYRLVKPSNLAQRLDYEVAIPFVATSYTLFLGELVGSFKHG